MENQFLCAPLDNQLTKGGRWKLERVRRVKARNQDCGLRSLKSSSARSRMLQIDPFVAFGGEVLANNRGDCRCGDLRPRHKIIEQGDALRHLLFRLSGRCSDLIVVENAA